MSKWKNYEPHRVERPRKTDAEEEPELDRLRRENAELQRQLVNALKAAHAASVLLSALQRSVERLRPLSKPQSYNSWRRREPTTY